MFRRLAVVALLPVLAASPAAAVTWVLGGTVGNVASVTVGVPGAATLVVTAQQFTIAPSMLTNISDLGAALQVRRTAPGVGVNGGASNEQLDTNMANRREALVVTADKAISLTGLKLSFIDANDTLQIYGVGSNGALTSLGFGGTISAGLGGAASFTNTAANNGTTVLTFDNALALFSRYVFTTRAGGDVLFGGDLGQGYRIDSISANVVPEPESWVMLIAGFGLVGAISRRRRKLSVVA